MRLTRPWFTVRGLMIVVAVTAILIGGTIWVRAMEKRRTVCLEWAAQHEFNIKIMSWARDEITEDKIRDGLSREDAMIWIEKELAYNTSVMQAYRRAATRPWAPLTPGLKSSPPSHGPPNIPEPAEPK